MHQSKCIQTHFPAIANIQVQATLFLMLFAYRVGYGNYKRTSIMIPKRIRILSLFSISVELNSFEMWSMSLLQTLSSFPNLRPCTFRIILLKRRPSRATQAWWQSMISTKRHGQTWIMPSTGEGIWVSRVELKPVMVVSSFAVISAEDYLNNKNAMDLRSVVLLAFT